MNIKVNKQANKQNFVIPTASQKTNKQTDFKDY